MIDTQFSLNAAELRSVALRFGDPQETQDAAWISGIEFERRGPWLVVLIRYRNERPASVPRDRVYSRHEDTGFWEAHA